MAWNQSVGTQKPPRKTPRGNGGVLKGLAAGVIVLAGAVVAWLFVRPQGANAPAPKRASTHNSSIQEVVPAPASAAKATDAEGTEADTAKEDGPVDLYQGKRVVSRVAQTNENGTVDETIKTEDGKTYGYHHSLKPRLFTNPTDQLIALVTSTPQGGLMPPLPPMTKADTERFIESITTPMEIGDEDDDSIRAMKERVNKMRGEIAAVLAAEPNIELKDLLTEHREIFNEHTSLHNEAQAEYDRILSTGDAEGAKEYFVKMNEALGEMGVPPVIEAVEEEGTNE